MKRRGSRGKGGESPTPMGERANPSGPGSFSGFNGRMGGRSRCLVREPAAGSNGGKAFRRGSAIPDGWIGQGTIPRQEDCGAGVRPPGEGADAARTPDPYGRTGSLPGPIVCWVRLRGAKCTPARSGWRPPSNGCGAREAATASPSPSRDGWMASQPQPLCRWSHRIHEPQNPEEEEEIQMEPIAGCPPWQAVGTSGAAVRPFMRGANGAPRSTAPPTLWPNRIPARPNRLLGEEGGWCPASGQKDQPREIAPFAVRPIVGSAPVLP